ncbi:WbuC family cupin fold metalloprotein [Granulosicoccaceae sp. 1_MG-2023]|nr:WbuC family cupin fold metalloprotein [Granulosicoccaceae sp. 1_MG-2023]
MKLIDTAAMDELSRRAAESPRLRAHQNFHANAAEAVQRLMIAMQPGTFVPVHCHERDGMWELLMIQRGEVECVIFDGDGQVLARHRMCAGGQLTAIELPPGTWHSVICRQAGTVIFEVKPGPYDPAQAARRAPWCPDESDAQRETFRQWLEIAPPGSRWES